MTITTVGVVSAVTPSVVETYISHYLNHGALKKKPTAHISYHEGLRLVRQFLDYASKHAVEDIQQFTAQWVPAPTWVRTENFDIPHRYLHDAAKHLKNQLGERGIAQVGGADWWQWRRTESGTLRAEWIEMKKDIAERKKSGAPLDRVMLYVHGGAYYFGSVDEHRYQIQRHARKLKIKVLAPRYRLAPQYPFPCGLHDCISAYLYLLDTFDASQILVAGDSAGGGMVLSLLVTLRDQGIPLPAGGILLSPWVDLTHSFPSVAGDGSGDYIPSHGFHHKPSLAWPPPNADEMATLRNEMANAGKGKDPKADSTPPNNLSVLLDGVKIEIKDQIQMYAENSMLAHPLVSPVQQPSLGGLPPLLIQTGGAELLHDEQVYLAHKAANPQRYRPSNEVINQYGLARDDVTKYDPTYVQLQVWEDLCHVPHTLSFTRPAKYMFRSVAQFGAWALAHAQHKDIEIEDDANSIISSGTDTDNETNASTVDLSKPKRPKTATREPSTRRVPIGGVGRAGDPLPPFKNYMIRQRVDRHGLIYPLGSTSEMAFLHLEPSSIGTIKPTPVRKWLAKKKEHDTKYVNDKKKVQKKRLKEMSAGYEKFPSGDVPPPTALAGRRKQDMPAEKKAKKSWALALWAGWGWHHDEETIEREEKAENDSTAQDNASAIEADRASQPPPSRAGKLLAPGIEGRDLRRVSSTSMLSAQPTEHENGRPRSAYRKVSDNGQANEQVPAMDTQGSKRSGMTSSTVSPGKSSHEQSIADRSEAPHMSEVLPDRDGNENLTLAGGKPNTASYPFKVRGPLSPMEGDAMSIGGGTATTRSTPAQSMAPVENMVAEKEVIMPTYDEKEVVVSTGAFPPRAGIDRMPSELAAYPQGSSPVSSKPSKPDTYSPTASGSGRKQSLSSQPSTPVETYKPREEPNRVRNPAFDQAGAATTKFGASNNQQSQIAGPPKPVGFAYNPRDLRHAMLNRQAAEHGTNVNGASYEQSPRSMHSTPVMSPAAAFTAPVELPAMAHNGTDPDSNAPIPTNSADEIEPVELSTFKQTRASVLPPPRVTLPETPTLELSAVKQTRNSILPAPRAPNTRHEMPTSLDSDDSLTSEDEFEDDDDDDDDDEYDEDEIPIGIAPESPAIRPMTAASHSTGKASQDGARNASTVPETPSMSSLDPRKSSRHMPAPLKPSPRQDDDKPPTPPPKDIRFAKSGLSHSSRSKSSALTDSPKKSSVNGTSVSSDASEELPRSRGSSSKPPVIGDLSFGGGLGLS